MIEFFWGCLIGGILFALFQFLAGDLFGHAVHGDGIDVGAHHFDFLQPTTIVSAITAFGAAGILFARYTSLEPAAVIAFSIAGALVISSALHFLLVRPMRRAESSLGFSMTEYVGMIGEVTVPIPEKGYGEVMVRMGAGNTCQIASSFEESRIPSGRRVVVVEIRNDTLVVAPYES